MVEMLIAVVSGNIREKKTTVKEILIRRTQCPL